MYIKKKLTILWHLNISPVAPLSKKGHGEGVAEDSEDLDTFLAEPRFFSECDFKGLPGSIRVVRLILCLYGVRVDILRLLRVGGLLLLCLSVEAGCGGPPRM